MDFLKERKRNGANSMNNANRPIVVTKLKNRHTSSCDRDELRTVLCRQPLAVMPFPPHLRHFTTCGEDTAASGGRAQLQDSWDKLTHAR